MIVQCRGELLTITCFAYNVADFMRYELPVMSRNNVNSLNELESNLNYSTTSNKYIYLCKQRVCWYTTNVSIFSLVSWILLSLFIWKKVFWRKNGKVHTFFPHWHNPCLHRYIRYVSPFRDAHLALKKSFLRYMLSGLQTKYKITSTMNYLVSSKYVIKM